MNGVEITPAEEVDERAVLRQAIEEDKAELLDAVGELKAAVTNQFQLRASIAEHPVPWLVGGLLLGLWLSSRSSLNR